MFSKKLQMLKHVSNCNSIITNVVNFTITGFKFQRIALFSTDSNPCLAEYLVQSLGFSQQQSLITSSNLFRRRQAATQSNKVSDFNFAANADSVISFFKEHGFDETHLRKVVCCDPSFLTANIDKSLKPKLHLLQDLGFSGPHLVDLIVKNPMILRQRLGPAIQALRDVLGTDDFVACVLKRSKRLYMSSLVKNLSSNVALLENEYGIPKDEIRKHILRNARPFVMRSEVFRGWLNKVETKLGIPRDSPMFFHGLILATLSDKNIESKCQVFKSFGWTDSDVSELIKRQPLCLNLSEANIKRSLEVLINEVGYKPDYLVSRRSMLTYSIDKRILPRHRILTALKQKGLLREDFSLYTSLKYNERKFLQRFVIPFEEVHKIFAKETGCCEKWLKEQADNHS